LRFDRSIVSRSRRVTSPNPVITTFFTGEAVRHINIRKSNKRYPPGHRRGHAKPVTHTVHIRCRQLRRAKHTYWEAWSTAPGLVSLQHGYPEPLYGRFWEGERGAGIQRRQSDDRGTTNHRPMS
jgi:hypothetical protein